MVKGLVHRIAAAALLVVTAGAATAEITRYDCTFQTGTRRDGNWVPEVLVLVHDTEKAQITVFDPIIRYFVGNPIPATQSDRTSARVSYIWEVVAQKEGLKERQQAIMRYRFSYYTNGQPARMRVSPLGFDNEWEGEGTCKVKKG